MVLLSPTAGNAEATFLSGVGAKIDVFTQKEPFSGKGLNVSSDAFSLDERVKIFALVTYSDWPENGLPVAFQILGPSNPVDNITFTRAAYTNESGIATITFLIPNAKEMSFGEWTIIGNVKIADQVVQDRTTFKVGLIVEIASIKTITEEYVAQEKFNRNEILGIQLILRSIALTEKTATLTIALYDSMGTLIDSTEKSDFTIQPDGEFSDFHHFLRIPESTHIGDAIVYACAYTAPLSLGGVPYCPEVTRHFTIVNLDISILSIHTSCVSVYEGEIVEVEVCVENKGTESQSFNVSAYFNATLIHEILVSDLWPSSNLAIDFFWDTSNVGEGAYLLSAYAEDAPGELDVADNFFYGPFVEVKSLFHDVAILNLEPSSTSIYLGDSVEINVIVENQGNFTESFEVTLLHDSFHGSNVIDKLIVENLEPRTQKRLCFHWDTQDVAGGKQALSAVASQVPGEENLANNRYTDCFVNVFATTTEWFISASSTYVFLFLVTVPLVVFFMVLLHSRNGQSEETKKAFLSGWTAWYSRTPLEPTQTGACKKCGMVFTQPLLMYSFKSEKPKLVNLCPYCNVVLGVAASVN